MVVNPHGHNAAVMSHMKNVQYLLMPSTQHICASHSLHLAHSPHQMGQVEQVPVAHSPSLRPLLLSSGEIRLDGWQSYPEASIKRRKKEQQQLISRTSPVSSLFCCCASPEHHRVPKLATPKRPVCARVFFSSILPR